MSINIHISATRQITYTNKRGEKKNDKQKIKFNCWQTPSEVSRKIVASYSPLAEYKEWVRSQARVEKIALYRDDDLFCEGPIIGYDTFCEADEHLEQLDVWLMMCEDEGYKIEVEAW